MLSLSPNFLHMGQNKFKPRSKFERWVRSYGGTKRLAKKLGVNQSTVQHWCAGRARPGLGACYKMVDLSKGEITLLDIVRATRGL